MEKSVAALMIAMVVSVMGIPLAYLAGQGSAQAALKEELERSRANQDEAIAAMKDEIAEMERRQLDAGNRSAPTAAPQDDRPAPPVALDFAIFEQLTTGMDYKQIVKILGREGTRTLSIEDGSGVVTEQFIWDWTNPKGTRGKIDLAFLGGKLEGKSYKE